MGEAGAGRGEDEEKVWHAGDLGCESDAAAGEGGNRAAGGSEDHGEGFEDVDVELIGGVADIGAAPGDGGRCGGGLQGVREGWDGGQGGGGAGWEVVLGWESVHMGWQLGHTLGVRLVQIASLSCQRPQRSPAVHSLLYCR